MNQRRTRQDDYASKAVYRSPLVSPEQRQFLEGAMPLETFVATAQRSAERRAQEEVDMEGLRDTLVAVILFGAVSSGIFIAIALFAFAASNSSTALGATIISVALAGFAQLVSKLASIVNRL